MENILEINVPAIDINICDNESYPTICICCLTSDGVFVNLISCSHFEFLKQYLNNKIPKMYVCVTCHHMLRKIEMCRQNVVENITKLQDMELLFINKSLNSMKEIKNNFNNLTITKTVTYTYDGKQTDQTEEYESNVANIDECEVPLNNLYEEKPNPNIVTFMKDESDSDIDRDMTFDSQYDSDRNEKIKNINELNKSKNIEYIIKYSNKSKKPDEKYLGKIHIYNLSEEEVLEERDRDRVNPDYLKLPYKCDNCIKGYNYEYYYNNHLQRYHTPKENSVTCHICKCVLNKQTNYITHIKRHKKRFQCAICLKKSTDLYTLVNHFNQCHAECHGGIDVTFTCHKCNYSTGNHRQYRYHLEKHRPKEASYCDICDKGYPSRTSYNYHVSTVHQSQGKSIQCEMCPKVYKTRSALQNHVTNKHGGGVREYCCTCNTYFANKTSLKQHYKRHKNHRSENDIYICDYCNKKYTSKSILVKHIEWEHLKKYQHICNICAKPFRMSSWLKRHIKYVHNKFKLPREKMCDHCGKGFATAKILENHIRTHTGERPFVCMYCDATFAHSASLYTHKRLVHKVNKNK